MSVSLYPKFHYGVRSLRPALGFLRRHFIHCNLQITRRCNIDNRGNAARCTEMLDEPAGNLLSERPY